MEYLSGYRVCTVAGMVTNNPIQRTETLLAPEDVKLLLGLKSRTNHTLTRLAKRGILHPVRLGARTYRYKSSEIERVIAGGVTQ